MKKNTLLFTVWIGILLFGYAPDLEKMKTWLTPKVDKIRKYKKEE